MLTILQRQNLCVPHWHITPHVHPQPRSTLPPSSKLILPRLFSPNPNSVKSQLKVKRFAVIPDHQPSFVNHNNYLGFMSFHFKLNKTFFPLPLCSAAHLGQSHFTVWLLQLWLHLPASSLAVKYTFRLKFSGNSACPIRLRGAGLTVTCNAQLSCHKITFHNGHVLYKFLQICTHTREEISSFKCYKMHQHCWPNPVQNPTMASFSSLCSPGLLETQEACTADSAHNGYSLDQFIKGSEFAFSQAEAM